ncbi:TPA: hypothetical protein ACIVTK_003557, partial [Salmonella enterica subsp. enterica serovar Potsdam]
ASRWMKKKKKCLSFYNFINGSILILFKVKKTASGRFCRFRGNRLWVRVVAAVKRRMRLLTT